MIRVLKLTGELISDRFLMVRYYGGDQGLIECGCGILELSMDAHTLKGCFSGIGPYTGGMIQGTIELMRVSE